MKNTGLIIGKGRWKKELREGDKIVDEKGNVFKIEYQNEWACFMANQRGGLLLHLAQNSKWDDGTCLDISKCKLSK